MSGRIPVLTQLTFVASLIDDIDLGAPVVWRPCDSDAAEGYVVYEWSYRRLAFVRSGNHLFESLRAARQHARERADAIKRTLDKIVARLDPPGTQNARLAAIIESMSDKAKPTRLN